MKIITGKTQPGHLYDSNHHSESAYLNLKVVPYIGIHRYLL